MSKYSMKNEINSMKHSRLGPLIRNDFLSLVGTRDGSEN